MRIFFNSSPVTPAILKPSPIMHPKLITDTPATSDSLESHDRIANALFKLIDGSKGGKTIGLEGAWGSGKSSVIKLLEDKTVATEHIYLFKFDAWTHQGEPLRRAFLEELFDNVLSTNWFQGGLIGDATRNKWKKVRDELSQKIKLNVKSIVPETNIFGLLMIISFLLVPSGTSILSPAIISEKTSKWKIAIGSLIAGAPLMLMLLTLIYVICKNWNSPARNDEIKNVIAKFTLRGQNSEATKTSESVDPTTIEFQKRFKEFMSDALSTPIKRLVIVIDNLDRLSEKEVEAAWPILRSFVDNPDYSREPWFEKFWVIIPFAPSALKPATSLKDEAKEGAEISPAKQAGFLEKVIHVNFSVPTPILSNLKKYLGANLRAAFGDDIDENLIHKIFLIVSNELEKEQLLTPRLIVSLINNMVGTAIQWPDIDLASHGYFAVLRRKMSVQEIGVKLTGGQLITPHYDSIFSASIALDLAVLSCNVEAEVAAQRLYGDELEKALTSDDDGLKITKDYEKVGYAEVLTTLLNKNLANTALDPFLLTKKVATLLSPRLAAKMRKADHQHTLKDTRNALKNLAWLPVGEDDFRKIIRSLPIVDHNKMFIKAIVPVLAQTKLILEENFGTWPNGKKTSPVSVVSSWKKFRRSKKVIDYFGSEFSFTTLSIPGPFEKWVRICHELNEANETSEGFPPKITTTEIFRQLRETQLYMQPPGPFISACRSLEANGIAVPDELVSEAFVGRINRQAEFPVGEVIYTIPFVIEKASSSKSIYNKLVLMDPSWVFYYFGAIFHEKPSHVHESDLQLLRAEITSAPAVSTIIANLIFIWVLQGMKNPDEKSKSVFLQGKNFLYITLSQQAQNEEIIRHLQHLLSLNEEWRSIFIKSKTTQRTSAFLEKLLNRV